MATLSNLFIVILLLNVHTCWGTDPGLWEYIGPDKSFWGIKTNWLDWLTGDSGTRLPGYPGDLAFVDQCKTLIVDAYYTIDDFQLGEVLGVGCGGRLMLTGSGDLHLITMTYFSQNATLYANSTDWGGPTLTIHGDQFEFDVYGTIGCAGAAALTIQLVGTNTTLMMTDQSQITYFDGTCYILLSVTYYLSRIYHYGRVNAPKGGYLTYRSFRGLDVVVAADFNTTAPFVYTMDPSPTDNVPYTTNFTGNWLINGVGNTTFNFDHPFNFQSGTFTVAPGATLNMPSGLNLAGGNINIGAGATIIFKDTNGTFTVSSNAVISGSGTFDNRGAFVVTNGANLQVTAGNWLNSGNFTVQSGAQATIKNLGTSTGIFTANGNLSLPPGASVAGTINVQGGTLTSNGTLSVGNLQVTGGRVSCAGAVTVSSRFTATSPSTITSPIRITGSSTLSADPGFSNSVVNTGSMTLSAQTLNLNGVNAAFNNSGTVTVGSTTSITGTGSFSNQGTLTVNGALTLGTSTTNLLAAGTVSGSGTLTLASSNAAVNVGTMASTLALVVNGAATFPAFTTNQLTLSGGKIKDSTVTVTGAFVFDGTLDGSSVNASTVTMTTNTARTINRASLLVSSSGTFSSGSLNFDSSSSSVVASNGLVVAPGATFSVGGPISSNATIATVVQNFGTVVSSVSNSIGYSFVNSASLSVTAGTLCLLPSGTFNNTGTVTPPEAVPNLC